MSPKGGESVSEGSSLAGWAGCIHGMCGYSDLGAAASAEGGWGSPLCDLAPVLVVTVLAWEGQGEEGSPGVRPAALRGPPARRRGRFRRSLSAQAGRGWLLSRPCRRRPWGGGVCELLWGVLSGADAATGPGDGPQGHVPGSRAERAGGLGPLTPELCPL